MASSIGSKVMQLIVGGAAVSALGLSTINSIRDAATPAAIQRAQINTGDQYVLTTEDSTPSVLLNDETTAIKTYSTVSPDSSGEEVCDDGFTGALLCTMAIKLTGSGGHRNHNAGSVIISTTATSSIIDVNVLVESGSDALYLGWTTNPGGASGAQLVNYIVPNKPRGGTIVGSGGYTYLFAGTPVSVPKDVPPNATVKATWRIGNSTEDYSRTHAVAVLRYWKWLAH